ncbi:hypothetical protein E2C01_058801 [Portunus trituberculatus]|uniref:Uncharacterized protein n=1 Tax=Portunus trituberculatus TaxID=210409 RepID=A0A5B7GWI2_PORTR|nr:hypothetical protein [Portunus trituberculatus]
MRQCLRVASGCGTPGGREAEGETWPRGVVGARPISALFGHWGQWVVDYAHRHAPTDVALLGAPSLSLNIVLPRAPVAVIEGVDVVAISHAAPVPAMAHCPLGCGTHFLAALTVPINIYGVVPPTHRSSRSTCPVLPVTPPAHALALFLPSSTSSYRSPLPARASSIHPVAPVPPPTPCSLHGFLRSPYGMKAEETTSRRLTSTVLKPSLQ